MNSILLKTLIVAVGIFALIVGFWLSTKPQSYTPIINENTGIAYPQAREIGDFKLIDYNRNQITAQQLKGKWWLVYFGFTFCPDACPMALENMKKTKALLDPKLSNNLGYALISVDPNRDTPQRLKEYVHYFDPEFYAMTGEPKELEELATKVGVVFIVPENPKDENYNVDHSSFILLWNPDVNLKAILKAPHNPKEMATAIKKIIATSS